MSKIPVAIIALSCGMLSAHATQGMSTLTQTGITSCSNQLDNKQDCRTLHTALQDGHVQSGEPMSYRVLRQNEHECVKDNVTGLIWEQKTNDGSVRHKDNVYAWYEPNSYANGGNASGDNGGKNIHTHVQELNAMNYCGYNDWRMPNVAELRSLVDFGKHGLTIDPIFTHSLPYYYWAISPDSSHKDYAWVINFYNGDDNYYNKKHSHYVRAVRSDAKK